MKFIALAVAVFMFAGVAHASLPFNDVPRTHWAYESIQKAVDAGILQGYDGKFEGQRLLNRYQMAVVVAKLLDAMRVATPRQMGRMGAPDDVQRMIANLEALTIEFADELALLNVKVSTLEDSFQELRYQMEAGAGRRAAVAPAHHGGLGITAFASFGLIGNDSRDKTVFIDGVDTGFVAPTLTRDFGADDTTHFELPQVSLGVDKEVNPGVYFHAQFDFDAQVNGDAGVSINQAYFFVDEMFGDIGGKVGGFALPFSMEHNGPFRSLNYTITPSVANTLIESIRVYGIEFQQTKDVRPEDLAWKFGVFSGNDNFDLNLWDPFPAGNIPILSDQPARLNTGEFDDNMGFYIMLAQAPTKHSAFGWNISYFDNRGDINDLTHEIDFFNVGLEWSNDDMLVMAQYMDLSGKYAIDDKYDGKTWYLLVNFKIDEQQSITLRYDDFEHKTSWGADVVTMEGDAFTFAYNRKVTENSMLQFEYLRTSIDDFNWFGDIVSADQDDDIWQIRYKVHF